MNVLEKFQISPSVLGLLMYLKLNTGSEYVRAIIKQYLYDFDTESGRKPIEILDEAGYIKMLKTGVKSRPWESVRLSQKGETILKELNQKPMHPLAEFTLNYTKKEYERIGAKDKTKGGGKLLHYISEFLYEKEAYTEQMIKAIITTYVNSFEYDQTYMNGMGTLFFKPVNAYTSKWTPEDCPIWTFIEKNQDTIKYNYKKLK